MQVSDNGLVAFENSLLSVGAGAVNLDGTRKWVAPLGADFLETPSPTLKVCMQHHYMLCCWICSRN